MRPHFVKKFDFRGIYEKDIKDEDAYYLALAILMTLDVKKILVGWDTRESSQNLALSFLSAVRDKDLEISYLEKCPIDYITVSANAFDFDLSIMFTGSHNPWNWTGMLIHTRGGNSLDGKLVEKIITNYYAAFETPLNYSLINLLEYTNFREQVEKIYSEKIKAMVPLDQIKELKVLVDLGDGSGGKGLSIIEELLPQVEFVRMNDRGVYDEKSSHIADPSNVKNMQELITRMQTGEYDCGFAMDSDADRTLAVDEKGTYLNGSTLGSAQIQSFSDLNLPDTKYGYAVDCGPSSYNTVQSLNRENNKLSIIPIPVGRSLIRQKLRDGEIDFGIENVGHFYSKDFFMTDSGIFSLVVVLYWISKNGTLSSLSEKCPDGYRAQIATPVLSQEKINELILRISEHFTASISKKIEVDGIRFEFFTDAQLTSWYAIRKSGYEAIEKYYYGSLNEKDFEFFKKTFSEFLPDAKQI